jgi:uncharacterized protein
MPDEILKALHVVEFDYTRSLGPTLAAFFDGLANRKIIGAKTVSGTVVVPPTPHDPETGEDVTELIDVGNAGVVTTWSWVNTPRPKHPLDRPFAFALIKLDGADTAMLHAVDAGEESKMSTGMRVKARWAAEPSGSVLDLACFEPEGGPGGVSERSERQPPGVGG